MRRQRRRHRSRHNPQWQQARSTRWMPNSRKARRSRGHRARLPFPLGQKIRGRAGRTGIAIASATAGRCPRRPGTAGAADGKSEQPLSRVREPARQTRGPALGRAARHTSRRADVKSGSHRGDLSGRRGWASWPHTAPGAAKARGTPWLVVLPGAKLPLPIIVQLRALAECHIDLVQRARRPFWQRCLACRGSADGNVEQSRTGQPEKSRQNQPSAHHIMLLLPPAHRAPARHMPQANPVRSLPSGSQTPVRRSKGPSFPTIVGPAGLFQNVKGSAPRTRAHGGHDKGSCSEWSPGQSRRP
ncbi:hypothetical protein SAMN05421844_101110 [Bosea robiniae]|uniref:Uncharacterized protein n=1 Tax=Bosea robiniae TaxID=1036780 RepID=A0ABY0NCS1_9HYPH|nr:hypothetical protein SAMN05421844_101110 [Bosea robiniae]